MSILIKGMEMPTSCMLCPLCVEEADPANGEMCMVTGTLMPPCTRERLDNCPLVPVPPHGRLIDADAFAAEMKKRQEEAEKWLREAKDRETAVRADAVLSFLCEVKLTLDAAPTIIKAEGRE